MELPQDTIDNDDDFIRVKVFMSLMTPNSSEFTNVEDEQIRNSAQNDKNAVISALSVKFENVEGHQPLDNLQYLVKQEMQNTILKNVDLAKIIAPLTQDDVINAQPERKPKTDSIQVAEYIVSPNKDGLIGFVDFEQFEKIFV
jgi:hypothetical protein